MAKDAIESCPRFEASERSGAGGGGEEAAARSERARQTRFAAVPGAREQDSEGGHNARRLAHRTGDDLQSHLPFGWILMAAQEIASSFFAS